MHVGKSENISFNNSNNPSCINAKCNEQEPIFDFSDSKVVESDDSVSVTGTSATVNLDTGNSKSIVPGFEQRKLVIKTQKGNSFTINLHVSQDMAPEMLQEMLPKLVKSFANMPEDVLNNYSVECKHILLADEIPYNKDAKALAIGPLNQIFISAEKFSMMREEDCMSTLVHELGHLIDYSQNPFIMGKATDCNKKEFSNLALAVSKDSGYDYDMYMLSSGSELFADYYAYRSGVLVDSNTRNSKSQIDRFEAILSDSQNLNEEALSEKYQCDVQVVKDIANAWGKIKHTMDYYLSNVESGLVTIEERANLSRKPMNFAQIDEHNANAEK